MNGLTISATPVRISLCGGGTDFPDYYNKYGGVVLSTTIDKYIYVCVKKRFDNKIRVGYSITELADSVDEVQHELVREALRMTGVTSSVEISTMADIPSEGSGLGSSSSVTVGLLNALYAYQGIQVTAERLAQEACQIEIDILKKPIGKQDQYIAAYGGMRKVYFSKHGIFPKSCMNEQIASQFGNRLLLFFTGKTRQSSDILTEQNSNCELNANQLRILKAYVVNMKEYILHGSFDAAACLLNDSWELKKQLASGITNPEIDAMYSKARNAGALGGKLLGAGGGGFLLLYVRQESQDDVRDALHDYKEMPFALDPHGSRIIHQG